MLRGLTQQTVGRLRQLRPLPLRQGQGPVCKHQRHVPLAHRTRVLHQRGLHGQPVACDRRRIGPSVHRRQGKLPLHQLHQPGRIGRHHLPGTFHLPPGRHAVFRIGQEPGKHKSFGLPIGRRQMSLQADCQRPVHRRPDNRRSRLRIAPAHMQQRGQVCPRTGHTIVGQQVLH